MKEQKQNPYAKPTAQSEKSSLDQAYATLKRFSFKGRIGRLRYICFTLGVLLVSLIITFLLVSTFAISGFLSGLFIVPAYIIILFLTILRCNDFNFLPWLGVLICIIVPITFFILFFIPGTEGDNQYGSPLAENSRAIVVFSVLLLILCGLAIVALAAFALIGSI